MNPTDNGLMYDHNSNCINVENIGLTKREHFAAMVDGDFYCLTRSQQEMIAGKAPLDLTIDFAIWLAKGRGLWRVMQADALIEALNKEKP